MEGDGGYDVDGEEVSYVNVVVVEGGWLGVAFGENDGLFYLYITCFEFFYLFIFYMIMGVQPVYAQLN